MNVQFVEEITILFLGGYYRSLADERVNQASIPHQVSHTITYMDINVSHSVSNAWLQEDLSKVHLAFLIWVPHTYVPMGRGG